jgi:hypothetical protein
MFWWEMAAHSAILPALTALIIYIHFPAINAPTYLLNEMGIAHIIHCVLNANML